MAKIAITVLLGWLMLVSVSSALAQIYVWEDESGTHAVTDPKEVPPAVLQKFGLGGAAGNPPQGNEGGSSASATAAPSDSDAVVGREKFDSAMSYLAGAGGPKDVTKGIELLTAAAERGNPDAQFALGALHYLGKGVPRDLEKAYRLFKEAAEQGNPGGQCGLAGMYANGEGRVIADVSEAIRYYRLAGEQQKNGEVPKAYTELISYSVLRYYTLKAERGSVSSQLYLGGFCLQCNKYKEAYRYFRLAAEQGDGRAQRLLGEMYLIGLGVTKNHKEAAEWFQLSARQNDVPAQRSLAVLYRDGSGVEKNPQEAFRWFLAAAENNDVDSFGPVGAMYLEGTAVSGDFKLGLQWVRKAADYGDDNAQALLGAFYTEGRYMERNHVEALKWYMLAAAKGKELYVKLKNELASTLNSIQIEGARKLAKLWTPLSKPDTGKDTDMRDEADRGLNLAPNQETIALFNAVSLPLKIPSW